MKFIVTSFCLFGFFLNGQNLVLNPSFESYYSCPNGYDQISSCKYWTDANATGSEYFNVCASSTTCVNVPRPICGDDYQNPKSGLGYAGLNSYSVLSSNLRQYIEGSLSAPLINGVSYCVKFYCNLSQQSKYATNNVGIYFSNSAIYVTPPPYLMNYTPQIFSSSIISDTISWTEVNSVISASGGEQFLLIGNFFSDGNTQKQLSNSSTNYSSYYYIDDVSIEELKPAQLKNDTVLTFCDSLILGNNLDSASVYSWWPNKNISDTTSPNPTAWPDSTTTYYVTKTQCTSITTDSVKITVVNCNVGEKEYGVRSPVVRVFPNPGNGVFKIKYSIGKNSELVIQTPEDKIVSREFLFANTTEKQIDLTHLENGIYFYSIFSTGQRKFSGKIIIAK
jgi:hypothetical protein